jgi:hypothetical protein
VPDMPGVPDDAAGLCAANARLRELLAERDAEVAELRALVPGLQAQLADLAARAGQNSKNSSRPPSSDGLAKPSPKSLRNKSSRRPGRPKGQPGATMQLTDRPDRVVRHEPTCCDRCGRDLSGTRETRIVRRQVTEIPLAKAEVTEHQLIERSAVAAGYSPGAARSGPVRPRPGRRRPPNLRHRSASLPRPSAGPGGAPGGLPRPDRPTARAAARGARQRPGVQTVNSDP